MTRFIPTKAQRADAQESLIYLRGLVAARAAIQVHIDATVESIIITASRYDDLAVVLGVSHPTIFNRYGSRNQILARRRAMTDTPVPVDTPFVPAHQQSGNFRNLCRIDGAVFYTENKEVDICWGHWYSESIDEATREHKPLFDAIKEATGLESEIWQTGGMTMNPVTIVDDDHYYMGLVEGWGDNGDTLEGSCGFYDNTREDDDEGEQLFSAYDADAITAEEWAGRIAEHLARFKATTELRRLLDAWEKEEDTGRRGDLVMVIQDIADAHPELAAEASGAGVPL